VFSSGRIVGGLALACALLGAPAEAGPIHLRWGPDAPEQLANKDVLLYQELVAFRDSDIASFDRKHPFFGTLLSDPSVMSATVARWEAHEQRFEYWHPYLWQILNGYIHEPQLIGPVPPANPPGGGGSNHNGGSGSGGSGQGGGGGSVGPSGGGGGGDVATVPEPSSALLLVTGAGGLLLAACCLRARRHRPLG
jgi:uncharacterized membrane protein YgcG